MTTKNLRKRIKQKSFRPFTLATKAGKRFHIADELAIGISKCRKRVRVGIQLGDGKIWIWKPEELVSAGRHFFPTAETGSGYPWPAIRVKPRKIECAL